LSVGASAETFEIASAGGIKAGEADIINDKLRPFSGLIADQKGKSR